MGRRLKPKTTIIGSYPVFPGHEEVEQYYSLLGKASEDEETVDPFLRTVEISVADFLSAGIELPSTGQTRDHFVRLFLDPRFVKNIRRHDSEITVEGRIGRKTPIRLSDVKYAKRFLPRYYGFKEPITGPYTLARSCRLNTSKYADLRELAFGLAGELCRPEAGDLVREVEMIQFDEPYLSIDPWRDYIVDLYEELATGLKVPIVLHVCGDSVHVFKELVKLKADILSLDFTYNPRLLDEAARLNFDQTIGLGCVSTGSPIVEPVPSIRSFIERGIKKVGEDRVSLIHPGCGERNLPLDVAYQKNVNMVLARNSVLYGEPMVAQARPLREGEYDPNGYFVIQVEHSSQEILVSFNRYDHTPKVRLKANSGEKLLHTLIGLGLISDTPAGKRHLGYVGFELGKAETALKNGLPYRQDRPLSLKV